MKSVIFGGIITALLIFTVSAVHAQDEESGLSGFTAESDTGMGEYIGDGEGIGYDDEDKNLDSETKAGLEAQATKEFPVLMGDDEEEKDSIISDTKFEFYFDTAGYRFSNGDLRATDNSSYLTVDYTDDESFLVSSDLGVAISTTLLNVIEFNVELNKPGYWGNDSLTTGTKYNTVYTRTLNMDIDLASAIFGTDSMDLNLVVGRQWYMIGDTWDHQQYIYADAIDAIAAKFKLNNVGLGADFVFDFFSMNSPSDAIYSLKTARHAYVVPNFNGDVNTYRIGLFPYFMMESDGFMKELIAKAVVMFSRIGAVGENDYDSGGYEMSGIGYEGNFADNDWILLAGANIFVDTEVAEAMAEFAYSLGTDRKYEDTPTVNISGLMMNLSAMVNFGFINMDWLKIGLSGMYASGATTDEYGNYLNYGYVSMKGNKVGGYLFSRYWGNYPSANVNFAGIMYEPVEASRQAGTMAFSAKAAIENLNFADVSENDHGLNLNFDAWMYFDTSTTSMNTNLSLEANIYDQRRFGKFMGMELDLEISYMFRDEVLEVGAIGAIFMPMALGGDNFFYYPSSLEESPYGTDNFFGLEVYSSLKF